MAIVWRKAPGVFLNSLYDTLKVLEAPDLTKRLHLQSGLNTPTIGIGFDLKAGGDIVQKEVFKKQLLGTEPN